MWMSTKFIKLAFPPFATFIITKTKNKMLSTTHNDNTMQKNKTTATATAEATAEATQRWKQRQRRKQRLQLQQLRLRDVLCAAGNASENHPRWRFYSFEVLEHTRPFLTRAFAWQSEGTMKWIRDKDAKFLSRYECVFDFNYWILYHWPHRTWVAKKVLILPLFPQYPILIRAHELGIFK